VNAIEGRQPQNDKARSSPSNIDGTNLLLAIGGNRNEAHRDVCPA
jgi:hypothetical protein